MNETAIQKIVRDVLNLHKGVVVWRNSVGGNSRYSYGLGAGSADLIGICHGHFLAVEVKAPGKKPTKAQEAFLQKVRDYGGIAFWADSPEMAIEKIVEYV